MSGSPFDGLCMCMSMHMHAHAADAIHIPINGFTLFQLSTGGGNTSRNAAMCQQRQ